MPRGRVIYIDTNRFIPNPRVFYDPSIGLAGKPDYLVNSSGHIIPVEVKSTRINSDPYDSHLIQLAAYCYLVQNQLGMRPEFGILHYQNRTFEIPYAEILENRLLETVAEMRAAKPHNSLDRSHVSAQKCKHCGYHTSCDQRLL